MNARRTRRQFLTEVGQGMLMASIGCTAAVEMDLAPADAAEGPESLEFGPLEPLVALMQETPTNRLLPVLVERLRAGTELGALVAARYNSQWRRPPCWCLAKMDESQKKSILDDLRFKPRRNRLSSNGTLDLRSKFERGFWGK